MRLIIRVEVAEADTLLNADCLVIEGSAESVQIQGQYVGDTVQNMAYRCASKAIEGRKAAEDPNREDAAGS